MRFPMQLPTLNNVTDRIICSTFVERPWHHPNTTCKEYPHMNPGIDIKTFQGVGVLYQTTIHKHNKKIDVMLHLFVMCVFSSAVCTGSII